MPYINVHIDKSELLEELSDDDLVKELNERRHGSAGVGPNYSIPQRAARYTLEEAADIFRAQGRIDLAFKLEEIRTDFVMN